MVVYILKFFLFSLFYFENNFVIIEFLGLKFSVYVVYGYYSQ